MLLKTPHSVSGSDDGVVSEKVRGEKKKRLRMLRVRGDKKESLVMKYLSGEEAGER